MEQIKTTPLSRKVNNKGESIALVYQTANYDLFTTFEGNREPDHIAQLVKNFVEFGAIEKPIIVTINEKYPGKLVIVDGNNSFYARMQLGLPIPYIILENATERDMTALNITSKNWNCNDYVNFYALQGYADYIQFKYVMEKYGLGIRAVRYILQMNTTEDGGFRGKDVNSYKRIERGLFKIKDMERSQQVIDFLMEFKRIEGEKPWIYKNAVFVGVIVRLFNFDKFDPKRALFKFRKYPFFIVKQADAHGYINMMESAYNYRQGAGTIVSFNTLKFY